MLALPLEDERWAGSRRFIRSFTAILIPSRALCVRCGACSNRWYGTDGVPCRARVRHVDNMWDIPVDVDFIFYQSSLSRSVC